MIDYKEIERKWQAEWEKARVFESDVTPKNPYMVFAAFPYVNAPQHIGHVRTFGTADVLARYKRMRGFNVIYPMGFHATGTPILGFAKRLQKGDADLIRELKVFHISDEEIAKMTDPLHIADYFTKEIESGMRAAGYSIDWRRKLVSTEPVFSKFIEWQIGLLNSKGLLTKGRHPVGWCPNEDNAVGMHDTKHDVEPEIDQETAVKFRIDGEDAFLLCTTFRPETIMGVTNLFVNAESAYVICAIEGMAGKYYLSKAASENLKYQLRISQVGEVSGKELLSKGCINPSNAARIPVLPGFFVKEDVGTGIVMSVPAHAPFDYIAIERLKAGGNAAASGIMPIKVLDIDIGRPVATRQAGISQSASDMPALSYLKLLKADVNASDALIEEATRLEYKEESHWGRMAVPGYEGMSEPEAREKVKADLGKSGDGFGLYVLTNSPVYCRCGYRVVVKVVEDQWFINYGDKEWKASTLEAFRGISVVPEKTRKAFEFAIGWIDLRAVARAQGLGTRFPLDRDKIIESLSDSTIYMSMYTIINIIRSVDPGKLKPEFFDYVFLGKGDPNAVAAGTGVDYGLMRKARESFVYWYANTSSHSSPDLIFNHLTMYLYNHIAIFDKAYWPKQVVVNGTVLSEGEKMSKSLGNIVPLSDGISKHGADPLRFVVIAGADLFSDSEYNDNAVNGVKERLEYVYAAAASLGESGSGALKHIDFWLYSKLNRKVETATRAMEILELRSASTEALYNSVIELKRYFARGGTNGIVIRDYLSAVTLMLSPIAPHVSEEIWHMLGNTGFASTEKWPTADGSMISDKVERMENLVDDVIRDARQVIEITSRKGRGQPKEMLLIVAEDWKRKVNGMVAAEKNIGKIIEKVKTDKERVLGEEGKNAGTTSVIEYIAGLAKKAAEMKPAEMSQGEEIELLDEAGSYISGAIGVKIKVEKESDSRSERAKRAMPGKPCIDVIF
jgi:leucyl-tRNA synthetase